MTGCGEEESNLRPLGYEPNELPLLYPAISTHNRAWLFQLLSIQPNSESSTKCRLSDASSIMCFYFLECFYTTIHNNTPKRIEVKNIDFGDPMEPAENSEISTCALQEHRSTAELYRHKWSTMRVPPPRPKLGRLEFYC